MKFYLLFFIILLGVSCKQTSTDTQTHKQDIAAVVRQTLDSYHADIKHKGLLAEFKYLDSSTEFFWVPPNYTRPISYAEVVAAIRTNAQQIKSLESSWDTVRIIPLSESYCSYTGRLNSLMTDTANEETIVTIVETGLMVKRPTGWKLLQGQTTVLP